MKPLPWWLFAWVLAASVVVMMAVGKFWAEVFGISVLLAFSAILTFREWRG